MNNDWTSARTELGADGMLSIIMPAFRLSGIIGQNIRRVHDLFDGNIPYEIVVVDDGSGDGTAAAIEKAAAEFPDAVRPLLLMTNGGKGNAFRRGFAVSRGTHVLLLDADLDLLPERITDFFDIMKRDDADMVIGSKRHPDSDIDYPLMRRIASRVYYGIVKLLVGLPSTDTQTGMKLFRRDALQWSFDRMLVKRFAFDLEMLSIAYEHGYKVSEAPITMKFGDKMGALNFAAVRSVMTDTLGVFYRLKLIKYYQHVELSELSDPPPKVSVIIACPGPSSYLDEVLEGLAEQTLSPHEIIILPDEKYEATYDPKLPVRIMHTGRVRPAEKRNIGINAATGDVVAFLDDDTKPQSQWLVQACRHFSRPHVGASGGPAITPPWDPLMARLGGDVYASPLVSGNCRFRYVSERVRKVDDMPSCNLLVRTSILRKIGGFNTRYWPGEDTVLCMDVVNQGCEMIYDPFAVVFHHRRPLFGAHLRQIGRYAKHRGFFCRVFPQTSLRISYMIPSLFVLGLVLGPVACTFLPVLWWAYIGILGLYLLTVLACSWHLKIHEWLIVFMGIIATHIWYGIRFLQGLIFGRMPTEVKNFDHGGK